VLSHNGAKYDTQSWEDHTSTSNDVCYLGSTHCGTEETFKTRAWHADSLHKNAVLDASLYRLKPVTLDQNKFWP